MRQMAIYLIFFVVYIIYSYYKNDNLLNLENQCINLKDLNKTPNYYSKLYVILQRD